MASRTILVHGVVARLRGCQSVVALQPLVPGEALYGREEAGTHSLLFVVCRRIVKIYYLVRMYR